MSLWPSVSYGERRQLRAPGRRRRVPQQGTLQPTYLWMWMARAAPLGRVAHPTAPAAGRTPERTPERAGRVARRWRPRARRGSRRAAGRGALPCSGEPPPRRTTGRNGGGRPTAPSAADRAPTPRQRCLSVPPAAASPRPSPPRRAHPPHRGACVRASVARAAHRAAPRARESPPPIAACTRSPAPGRGWARRPPWLKGPPAPHSCQPQGCRRSQGRSQAPPCAPRCLQDPPCSRRARARRVRRRGRGWPTASPPVAALRAPAPHRERCASPPPRPCPVRCRDGRRWCTMPAPRAARPPGRRARSSGSRPGPPSQRFRPPLPPARIARARAPTPSPPPPYRPRQAARPPTPPRARESPAPRRRARRRAPLRRRAATSAARRQDPPCAARSLTRASLRRAGLRRQRAAAERLRKQKGALWVVHGGGHPQIGLHLVGLPRRLERVVLAAHRQPKPDHASPRLVLHFCRPCQPHPPLGAPRISRSLEVGGGCRERRRVLRGRRGAHNLPVRAAPRRALELELTKRQPCASAPLLGCSLEPAPRRIGVLQPHLAGHKERAERALALGIAVCRRALEPLERRQRVARQRPLASQVQEATRVLGARVLELTFARDGKLETARPLELWHLRR
eukprot:scaffold19437_cov66-Phaeocystis_antarctica.AAC.3